MTSKERMMIAVKGGKPDRLPVAIHQWQPYHLKKYMNDVTDIEANKACGLDAAITVYDVLESASPDWRVSSTVRQCEGYYATYRTIETPGGTLTEVKGTSPMTTWVLEPLVKRYEDIGLIRKYRPVPRINRELVKKTYDELGDDGIVRTFLFGYQGGCWQDACELYGAEKLIYEVYDNPDWVREFLQVLLDQKLKYIEDMAGLPYDLVETGGGAASNTIISPQIHEEFCLPFDARLHDALHSVGFPVVYHTCGGMTKITHLITRNNCDVSETLSPAGIGGDIETDDQAKKLYNELFPKVSLIGGMDQLNILEKGSREEISREVERLFSIYGKNGGYILSACDHFFETPVENLKWFAECAKKHTY